MLRWTPSLVSSRSHLFTALSLLCIACSSSDGDGAFAGSGGAGGSGGEDGSGTSDASSTSGAPGSGGAGGSTGSGGQQTICDVLYEQAVAEGCEGEGGGNCTGATAAAAQCYLANVEEICFPTTEELEAYTDCVEGGASSGSGSGGAG
jgi:hypothetical protein